MPDQRPRPLSHDDYTVGWISALAIESAAAAAMLDAEDPPLSVCPGDTNDYVLGRIGQHRVVMACINEARGLPAHVVATHMTKSFPAVRHMLMVGIGGGIPSKKYPVRLGDIVVSEATERSPGVVQSDFGKWEKDGFRVTGSLNRPSESLIRTTGAMRRNHLLKRTGIHALVHHFKGNVLHPEQWKYQGYQNDPLLRDDSEPRPSARCAECAASSEEYVRDPMVHYGIIASGNQVVKSRVTRDRIWEELGACCVEMEAFGLMNHFPCLVIRGVCDYADENKGDRWQQYAALAAAAYAKDLLLQVSSSQHTPTTSEQFEMITSKINALHEELHTSSSFYKAGTSSLFEAFCHDHQSDRILSWLSPSDPSSNLSEAKEIRCEQTGSWLLDDHKFRSWISRSRKALCLEGMPGSGKTILSSKVLDHLRAELAENQEDGRVALSFFFDFKSPNQQSLDDLLRSLAMQLYIHHAPTRPILHKLHNLSAHQRPTTDSLKATVRQMLVLNQQAYVVIDALDECKTRSELLLFLERLADSRERNVRLLVTTRKDKEIQSSLEQWLSKDDIIHVDNKNIAADIREYAAWRLREDPHFGRWRADYSLQNAITEKITQKADGMFRWAACQMDRLSRCLHRRAIQEVLSSMPDTLGETYTQILTQNKEHRRDAIRILQFLTFSDQPLTVAEMVDAIVVEPDGKIPFDPELRLSIPEEVASICPSLVSIVAKTDKQIVQLAHLSVKEYLTSDGIPAEFRESFEELNALATLTQVCLAYLSHLDDKISVDEIDRKYPFARFAARKWMEFAMVSEERSDVRSGIVQFFRSPQSYRTWRRLFNPEAPWVTEASDLGDATTVALYDASLGGLWRTVMALSSKDQYVDIEGGMYGSALQAASSRGHVMIAGVLLDDGARVNPADTGIYGCPLHAAAAEGHAELVSVLIRRGAATDRQIPGYGTALQVASAAGHTVVVDVLLEQGAAVNAVGGRYGTALQAACSEGHVEVVEMLLADGADVNCSGKIFHTTLEKSSNGSRYAPGRSGGGTRRDSFGNFRGPAVDSGPLRNTALQAACFRGHKRIVEILLAHGADIHASGGQYGDALQTAINQGHDDVRKLLLEHGSAHRNSDTNDHAAFRYQNPERPFRIEIAPIPYVMPAAGYTSSNTRGRARDPDVIPAEQIRTYSPPQLIPKSHLHPDVRNSRREFVYEPKLSGPAKTPQYPDESDPSDFYNSSGELPPRSGNRTPSNDESKPSDKGQGPRGPWASLSTLDEPDPPIPGERILQDDKIRSISEWIDNTLEDTPGNGKVERAAGYTSPHDSQSDIQYDEGTQTYIPKSLSSLLAVALGPTASTSRPISKTTDQHGAFESITSGNRLHQASTANGLKAPVVESKSQIADPPKPKSSSPKLDKDGSASQTEMAIENSGIAAAKRHKRTSDSQIRPSTPRRVGNGRRGQSNRRQQGFCCVVL
ncbi:uncharacterized protein APUU_20328A [Aspergillus puulaauensis]|uniref:NACHT domain-containing protein n=1 Tax=Aspergillus puulaauensis TaxID=1220207 RepID=A0A7R7XEU0_9EURO|nr:uncharacterized protein APUU_20328A [Aspergillus puulaauensis]BCS19896.1 hypothetical protein APUU_20328A [Aspergillus puulaauensis]